MSWVSLTASPGNSRALKCREGGSRGEIGVFAGQDKKQHRLSVFHPRSVLYPSLVNKLCFCQRQ